MPRPEVVTDEPEGMKPVSTYESVEIVESSEPEKNQQVQDPKPSAEPNVEAQQQTDRWERFVHHMAGKVNKSLVSLMRNSVLLEMSENHLTIGFKNTELFSVEKRELVEKEAGFYFKRPIQVFYKEDTDGIDDSIREKHEQELERQIEAQKKEAGESSRVKEVLEIFPGSSISQIRIISEKEDV